MFETAPGFLNPAPEYMQYNFNKLTLNQRFYVPLPLGAVFKVQLTVGYIQDINAEYPLPSSELYFLGGINTIRGYPLRSIAPVTLVGRNTTPDVTVTSFGVGGNKQIVFNAELEIPLLEKVGIRGVLFYDAGNAFAKNASFFENQPDPLNRNQVLPLGLYHSIGFGVRWFSPIGPLRFEWGIPLTRRLTDQAIQFEFTIGNSF
jgi:outer membrane protein insertion porin family